MRHRFHSLCPYFAMFPEQFVEKHLVWSRPGEVVFDPFSGRGTTVFASLLRGREAAGCDTNPVAVCVSNAKAEPPTKVRLLERLDQLEQECRPPRAAEYDDPFFRACFHRFTLGQLTYLRAALNWRRRKADRFIAAMALGCLHGESHRSQRYFSNRMPRTISTKPAYSVRWWEAHGCTPPRRDVFEILRDMVMFRYASPLPEVRGKVAHCDARVAHRRFPALKQRVSLVITSPPYLDTTSYAEDQWLRLWFLGGAAYPAQAVLGDDRHRSEDSYWGFLTESWMGIAPLLRDGAHIVIRLGGRRLNGFSCEPILRQSLCEGFDSKVRRLGRRSSAIREGQLRAFRPGAAGVQREYDFHFRVG